MHDSSYKAVQRFAKRYVRPGYAVVDVGSYDVNGTLRPLFTHCRYTGIDIVKGPNVDRVVAPYDWGDEKFYVVVSANVLEHVEDMVAWVRQAQRICEPGGFCCVVAPGVSGQGKTFIEHRHPVDCWRIMPDGMRWLFRAWTVLECYEADGDTVLVACNRAPS